MSIRILISTNIGGIKMANEEIKDVIKKKRLFRYEVAEAMGITEGYLSTLLRKPLSEEHQKEILDAINNILESENEKDDK
jgi:predicted XRE-type DNA-binding protein